MEEAAGTPPPTFAPVSGQIPWVEVVKRGRKCYPGPKLAAKGRPLPLESKAALVRRQVPRTSAVVIDRPTREGVTLTSVMKRVARRVELDAIDVKVRKTRRTKAGGILLEVEDVAGADRLAESVKAAVGGEAWVN